MPQIRLYHLFPVVLLLLLALAVKAQDADDTAFTLAVMPDTQKYARYDNSAFMAQTEWIAENAQALDIDFTVHLGDVVDIAESPQEWVNADTAMAVLESADLPYSILAGNHDVLDESLWDRDRILADEPYLQNFTPERAALHSTYGGTSDNGFNSYHIFEGAGQSFLVLALDCRVGDDAIAWTQFVLDAYPSLPTILTTHQLINIDGDGVTTIMTEYGQYLWESLIDHNNQIFLTLNGHHHGAAHMIQANAAGHDVLRKTRFKHFSFRMGLA